MSKKKKSKERKENGSSFVNELKTETLQAVLAIVFLVTGILTGLARFDKAGPVGIIFYRYAGDLFGIGYFLLPLICIILAIAFLQGIRQRFTVWKLVGGLLFLLSGLGLVDLIFSNEGGKIGHYISSPLVSLVDVYASAAILVALVAISLLITFEAGVTFDKLAFWRKKVESQKHALDSDRGSRVESEDNADVDDMVEKAEEKIAVPPSIKKTEKKKQVEEDEDFAMIANARSMKPF